MTQEMLSKLKPGMTKSQVRFIMGTPLVIDVFHADRWDYVYSLRKADELIEQRKLTLVFENDALKSIHGDVVPGASTKDKATLDLKTGDVKLPSK